MYLYSNFGCKLKDLKNFLRNKNGVNFINKYLDRRKIKQHTFKKNYWKILKIKKVINYQSQKIKISFEYRTVTLIIFRDIWNYFWAEISTVNTLKKVYFFNLSAPLLKPISKINHMQSKSLRTRRNHWKEIRNMQQHWRPENDAICVQLKASLKMNLGFPCPARKFQKRGLKMSSDSPTDPKTVALTKNRLTISRWSHGYYFSRLVT